MPKSKTLEVDAPTDALDLDFFRALLTEKQRELQDLYRHDIKVGQESTDDNADDFADRANNSYNRETMFALSDVERMTLIQIEEAFQRLDKGTYGICEYCGSPIGEARLKAVPWARYCIDCQEREERGLLD